MCPHCDAIVSAEIDVAEIHPLFAQYEHEDSEQLHSMYAQILTKVTLLKQNNCVWKQIDLSRLKFRSDSHTDKDEQVIRNF